MPSLPVDPAVFGNSSDAVYAVAPNGTVVVWNVAAEALFGYPAGEVLGRPCWTIVVGCNEDGSRVCLPDCAVRRAVRGGETPRHFEMLTVTKDGAERSVDVGIITAPNSEPGDDSIVHVVRDATAVRERLKQYRQAEASLRRARRAFEVVRECGNAISSLSTEQHIFDVVCRLLIDVGGYRLAWIALVDDIPGTLRPVAHAGFDDDDVAALAPACPADQHGIVTGTAVQSGRPAVARHLLRRR